MNVKEIDEIKSLEDIERFFTLLAQEHILYHPEVSFGVFLHRVY